MSIIIILQGAERKKERSTSPHTPEDTSESIEECADALIKLDGNALQHACRVLNNETKGNKHSLTYAAASMVPLRYKFPGRFKLFYFQVDQVFTNQYIFMKKTINHLLACYLLITASCKANKTNLL